MAVPVLTEELATELMDRAWLVVWLVVVMVVSRI
jgi:hypothetical protein